MSPKAIKNLALGVVAITLVAACTQETQTNLAAPSKTGQAPTVL